MTAPDLPAIKRALAAATPGPWFLGEDGAYDASVRAGQEPQDVLVAACDGHWGHSAAEARADAHLIAHAPEWLRALVARVRELEADAQRWREIVTIREVQRDHAADAERKRIVALLRERAATDRRQMLELMGFPGADRAASVLDTVADELKAGGEGGG